MAWSGGEEYSKSAFTNLGPDSRRHADVDVGFGGNFGQWRPAAPTLVGPGNTTSPGPAVTGTSQTFNWNAVSTATSYQLEAEGRDGGHGDGHLPGFRRFDDERHGERAQRGPHLPVEHVRLERDRIELTFNDELLYDPSVVTAGDAGGTGASPAGVQTISVSWNTVSGAASYTLDRAASSAGPWTQVYSGAAAQYGDSGLQFGTTYYYKVSASNSGGSSAFSSLVAASTYSGVPLDYVRRPPCWRLVRRRVERGLERHGQLGRHRGERAAVRFGKLEHGKRRHQLYAGPCDLVRRAVDAGLLRCGGEVH